MLSSRWASSSERSKPAQDEPPKDAISMPEAPLVAISAPVLESSPSKSPGPDHEHADSADASPRKSRTKVRVPWNGRQCVIWLPSGGPEAFGGVAPASKVDVERRMRSWQERGFDVDGFGLDQDSDSLTRHYCETQRLYSKASDGESIVRIPDPKAWKDYVDWLTEEKLRALGVGGFDDAGTSDTGLQPAAISFQPSLPSAMPGFPMSQRSTPGLSTFSTSSHSRAMSTASPMSSSSEFRVHAHRNSVFGGSQLFAQAPDFSPSMRAVSPSQQMSIGRPDRATSPALERVKNTMSPVPRLHSPIDVQAFRAIPSGEERQWTPPPRHDSLMQSFSSQHATGTMGPQLAEIPEAEPRTHNTLAGHLSVTDTGGLGHRHNASETLEKEIREAEEALESMEDRATQTAGSTIASENTVPVADSFSFRPQQLPFHTSAFQFGRPLATQAQFQAPQFGFSLPSMVSQTSFDPTRAAFRPQMPTFNFGADVPSLQPNLSVGFIPRASNVGLAATDVQNNSHSELDVRAPSFKPHKFGGHTGVLSSSKFDFSSSHTFQPGASAFVPASAAKATSENSIFGNISIPDVHKTARRNHALPIVRPSSSGSKDYIEKDESEPEDETGRLAQSKLRQKRAFRSATDEGDSVPLFAERPQSPSVDAKESNSSSVASLSDRPKDDSLLDGGPADKKGMREIAKVDDDASLDDLLIGEASDIESDEPEQTGADAAVAFRGHNRTPSSLSALAKPFTFAPVPHMPHKPAMQMSSFNFDQSQSSSLTLDPKQPEFAPARALPQAALSSHNDSSSDGEPERMAISPSEHLSQPVALDISREPSFDELDAVMQQINQDDDSLEDMKDFKERPEETPEALADSAVASVESSPRSVQIHPTQDMKSPTLSPMPTEFLVQSSPHSIRVPNSSNLRPSSEWSEDFTSGAGSQIRQQSGFLGARVDEMIAKAFKTHVKPLQDQLSALQQHHQRSSGPPTSSNNARMASSGIESDADDEDDDVGSQFFSRPASAGRARKVEWMKVAVLDALKSHKTDASPVREVQLDSSLSTGIDSIIQRLDALPARGIDMEAICKLIEKSMSGAQRNVAHSTNQEQSSLDATQDDRTKEMLRSAEDEIARLRLVNADKDQHIHGLQREKSELLTRLNDADASESRLQQKLTDLAEENAAQELTLEEYRASRVKWMEDQRAATAEEQRLLDTISGLKDQIADGINIRDNMREKLDRIQTDMAGAAEQLASQKSIWQHQNGDLLKRCAVFQARLDSESQLRNGIEEEIARLRILVSEGDSAKLQLEQSFKNAAILEETIQNLRDDVNERQTSNSRVHRELQDARENSRIEVQRAQLMTQAAIESANRQAEAVRAGLESKLSITNNEMENMKALMDAMKARHDVLLQEEADLRRDTLNNVNEASKLALDSLRKRHEEDVHFLNLQHARALDEAKQNVERSESFWHERLSLSDARHGHLQERIAHLEERLEIAKSAAQAAALAAQSAKSAPKAVVGSIPERVSPQALRESILVLQDQLQEREAHIERLQSQVTDVESDLPARLKEREIEVNWLRELLAVRSEDLNELIDNLSQQQFDREAAKDTAIRIRTAIQMEQAEKERHILAGASLSAQALAGLTNFASPKAAQLAAAIGNWRARGTPSGPTPSSLRREKQAQLAQSRGTPAKRPSSSSSSWMSGLMTPPASNLRRTPSPHSPSVTAQAHAAKRPDSRGSQTSSQTTQKRPTLIHNNAPATPDDTPLSFRRSSYDADAKLAPLSPLMDDDLDDIDVASPLPIGQMGSRSLVAELEPLG